MSQPTVFVCYDHRDEQEKKALLTHLGVLEKEGLIDLWSDDRIEAGADWKKEISQAIDRAKVALLLISANFLESEFISKQVIPVLLEQREGGKLIIFPVIAKHCAWENVSWLKQIQIRPKNGLPVWREDGRTDEELSLIAHDLTATVKSGLAPRMIKEEYEQIKGKVPAAQVVGTEEFEFQNYEKLRAKILYGQANHIELYGPVGVGKSYLLQHIGKDFFNPPHMVYIELTTQTIIAQILPEVIRQLNKTDTSPDQAGPADLARVIHNLYKPTTKDIFQNHFVFLFDSATEEHQEIINWLIGEQGLINNRNFRATLQAMGIPQDKIKLQVVIAGRYPVVKAREYHQNFHFERFPIDRLKKELDPTKDPIQAMLRELMERKKFPIVQNTCQNICTEVYYLTGGHPKCAKLLLLAVADTGFIPTQTDWQTFFKDRVLPVIQGEMLASIADIDLLTTFWVLSVFRWFDQRLLGTLLERQLLPPISGIADISRQARELRKRLSETYLVNEPQIGQPMFTLNFTVRRVLSLSMQYHVPERYRTINSIALEVFTEWLLNSRTPPERAILCLIELIYHRFKAYEINSQTDNHTICARIQTILQDYLTLLCKIIDEEDWSTYRRQLKAYWEEDEALMETSQRITQGKRCYENLSKQIEQFDPNQINENREEQR